MKQEVADFFAENLSDELLKSFGFTDDFSEIENQIAAFKEDNPDSKVQISNDVDQHKLYKFNVAEQKKTRSVEGKKVQYLINEGTVVSGHSPDIYLKISFPRSKKEGNLTLAQLDSGFIAKENGSKILADTNITDVKGVDITPYTEMSDPHKFMARFLVDEYNMKDPVVLVIQSKADKRHTFEISQGTYVKICGAFDWRINVRKLKDICPTLKESGIKSADFYAVCRLKSNLPFVDDEDKHLRSYTQLKKLLKKSALLEQLYNEDKLPMYESPDMKVIGWYLRK